MENIFEDLIEELKEENLLEETVIEINRKNSSNGKVSEKIVSPAEEFSPETTESFNLLSDETLPANESSSFDEVFSAEEIELTDRTVSEISSSSMLQKAASLSAQIPDFEKKSDLDPQLDQLPKPLVSEKEYFRKRAIDEVTGLQMVDHVLSGIEREQMKIIPKPFDELPVKKALHAFMQNQEDTKSAEHARLEFQLMQETESWYSALSHRDKHIMVAHLRRYCETTKPPLSPQALIALGRFYRNSPYSEQVRSKFDFVMTKLFSRENGDERRELLFTRDEIVTQLKGLYAEWASIQIYSDDTEGSEILIRVLKFEDFIKEAEGASSFDELIRNNFFNRLRGFKESCQENFFSPLITAAAIEANIRIGNRYVDLIEKEKEKANASILEEKYGFLYDQAISDATSKTLQLVELLKEKQELKRQPAEIVEVKVKEEKTLPPQKKVEKKRNFLFTVNKWLLGLAIFTVIACLGLYFWAESKNDEISVPNNSKIVRLDLDSSFLKDYLQTARLNGENFYGVTLTNWESMTTEKKEELLRNILAIGAEKGFRTVHLVNQDGKTVGFASGEKIEVYNP